LEQSGSALSRNAVTQAFVPMEQLIGPDNCLDSLRAMGCTRNDP